MLPIGSPARESAVEIKILKKVFTPEETKVATKLRFTFESLDNIYKRVDSKEMSINDLEIVLDNSDHCSIVLKMDIEIPFMSIQSKSSFKALITSFIYIKFFIFSFS